MTEVPPGPRLGTARLRLRRWTSGDRAPFAAINGDPEVAATLGAPLTRERSDALIDRIEHDFDRDGFGLWVVDPVDAPGCVGFVGLSIPRFEAAFTPCVEIGWRLARRVWGRGYATEAAFEVLRFGFEDAGLTEVVSFTARSNVRSQAVMHRLGMVHDPAEDFDHPSLEPGHPLRRHVLHRLSADEWRRLRSPDW